MNKEKLVSAVSAKTGLSKKNTEAVLDAVFQVIADTISFGDKVQVVGIGTFEIRERAPRVGRNPRTNTPVQIPAKRVAVFTPGKVFKDAAM